MKDYKTILEGVVNIINTTEKSDIGFANICTYIGENCPELSESADERIRKALIRYFTLSDEHAYNEACGVSYRDIVAWLENQGEHANFRNKIQIGDKVTRNEDGVLVNLSQLKRVAKPADKVEPKFKVGDWVVVDGVTQQVTQIQPEGFDTDRAWNGKLTFKDVHLWTIQDAKDGDVLAVEPIEGYSSSFVAIYKKQNEEDFDSYCFVGFDSKFYDGENGHSAENIHPATQEQRDTLMKAMADAGYEWDAEKKELKKIEQYFSDKYKDWYDFIRWFVKQRTNDYTLIPSDDDIHKWGDNILNHARKVLEQNNVEWSEEDEIILKAIILNLEECSKTCAIPSKEYVLKCIIWLKFLKDRYTWKPSEEMIEALGRVIPENVMEISKDEVLLDKLYQGLKYGRVLSKK